VFNIATSLRDKRWHGARGLQSLFLTSLFLNRLRVGRFGFRDKRSAPGLQCRRDGAIMPRMDATATASTALDQLAQARALAARYAQDVRRHFGPRVRRIRLYGSAARGDWTRESDVDVLVLLDDVSDADGDWLVKDAFHLGLIENRLLLQPVMLAEREFCELVNRQRAFAEAVEKEGCDL